MGLFPDDGEPFDDDLDGSGPGPEAAYVDGVAWWLSSAAIASVVLVLTRDSGRVDAQVLGVAVVAGCLYMARQVSRRVEGSINSDGS